MFNDDEADEKIMKSTNPYEIKAIGGSVKNFIRQRWEQEAKKIATEACMNKFSQNLELLDILLKTGNKKIGEASKDPLWGIGKALHDEDVLDSTNWPGENILGNVLMYVREQLKY